MSSSIDLWTAAVKGVSASDSTFSVNAMQQKKNVLHTCLLMLEENKTSDTFAVACPWITSQETNPHISFRVDHITEGGLLYMRIVMKVPDFILVEAIMISDNSTVLASQTQPQYVTAQRNLVMKWRSEDMSEQLYFHGLFTVNPGFITKNITFCKEYTGLLSTFSGCQLAMKALREGASDPDTIIHFAEVLSSCSFLAKR